MTTSVVPRVVGNADTPVEIGNGQHHVRVELRAECHERLLRGRVRCTFACRF